MVVLDTNILIDHLRRKGKISVLDTLFSRRPGESLAVSAVTIQELYEGESTREDTAQLQIAAIISELQVLPYTQEVAQPAGILMRDHFRSIEFADAAIAATAITHDAQLLTLNTKDFIGIPNLKLVKL